MKNPIFANLVGLANTGLSILREKRALTHPTEKGLDVAPEKGVNLSSTKIFGYGTGAGVIGFAVTQMQAQGITKQNLIVLGVGAALTISTQVIEYFKNLPPKK